MESRSPTRWEGRREGKRSWSQLAPPSAHTLRPHSPHILSTTSSPPPRPFATTMCLSTPSALPLLLCSLSSSATDLDSLGEDEEGEEGEREEDPKEEGAKSHTLHDTTLSGDVEKRRLGKKLTRKERARNIATQMIKGRDEDDQRDATRR